MICYKDSTFCRFADKCAKSSKCGRAYTDEVRTAAEASGLPVAFLSEPCASYTEFTPPQQAASGIESAKCDMPGHGGTNA